MLSILICISFNIIMKLILIIGFLLPLICSDALFIFSKTVFLFLFFGIIIISYFLVRLNITLLRKYFLRYIDLPIILQLLSWKLQNSVIGLLPSCSQFVHTITWSLFSKHCFSQHFSTIIDRSFIC